LRTYEVVFVAAPTLTPDELEAFVAQMQTVAEGKDAKVVKVDNWGKKTLAYRIRRFRDAYYVVLTIQGGGAAIAELERRFRVTDFVMRFLSVRIDEDLKRSDKLKAARQRKLKARPAAAPPAEAGSAPHREAAPL
jgi:small subunit ribosomal protein S6